MIPLYGFVQGDTMGLVVLAYAGEPIRSVAERLQSSAAVRVAPRSRVRILFEGEEVDAGRTLESLGARPLDRIDVLDYERGV